jgi:hypothetical protein
MSETANLPVDIAAQLRAEIANLNKMVAGGGNKVTYEGRSFKLPSNAGVIKGTLKAVILDFSSYNAFYKEAYDPKNPSKEAPECYAFGKFVQQLVPSANAKSPQSEACTVCPNNQFGSKGNGKACANKRVLAALIVNAPGGFDPETAPIVRIDVSSTAIKHWDKYVKDVANMFGVPPLGVVTDIFPDDGETYMTLRFGNPTPNPNIEVSMARKAEASSMLENDPHA